MANTTPTAIKAALNNLILGTTPRGKPGPSHRFRLLSDGHEIRSVAEADLGFSIDGLGAGTLMSFGSVDAAECQDKFTLSICHAKLASDSKQDDRIAENCQQLIQALIKPANLPNGVWRIWCTGRRDLDDEGFVQTELVFDITYSISQ